MSFNIYSMDSYLHSHGPMAHFDLDYTNCYMGPRVKDLPAVVFGLQSLIKALKDADLTITDADEVFFKAHGVPLNVEGLKQLRKDFPDGTLPLRIQTLKEGTVVKGGTPTLQITNTRKGYAWLPPYFEDYLLNAWAASSVATQSWMAKDIIRKGLLKSSDSLDKLDFMLVDFGMRACQTIGTAATVGQGHLLSFVASDNLAAIRQVQRDYDTLDVVGGSISASAHSVGSIENRDNELKQVRTILKRFIAGNIDGTPKEGTLPGPLLALVVDTYNDKIMVQEVILKGCRDLLDEIKAQGKVLIIRPDSGNPVTKVIDILNYIEEIIPGEITTNSKGYKQLPPYLAGIQGDQMSILTKDNTIQQLVDNVIAAGWSLDNIAFGSGGALLNGCNRDTLGYAYKLSAIKRNGSDVWEGVGKETKGKESLKGRLAVVKDSTGNLVPILEEELGEQENQFNDSYLEGVVESNMQTWQESKDHLSTYKLKDLF